MHIMGYKMWSHFIRVTCKDSVRSWLTKGDRERCGLLLELIPRHSHSLRLWPKFKC